MKSATLDDGLPRPTQPGEGLAAGVAAGVLATGCMLVASVPLEGPSVPELLAEVVAGVTPLHLIERLIQMLGTDAKRLLFTAVLVAEIVKSEPFRMRRGL